MGCQPSYSHATFARVATHRNAACSLKEKRRQFGRTYFGRGDGGAVRVRSGTYSLVKSAPATSLTLTSAMVHEWEACRGNTAGRVSHLTRTRVNREGKFCVFVPETLVPTIGGRVHPHRALSSSPVRATPTPPHSRIPRRHQGSLLHRPIPRSRNVRTRIPPNPSALNTPTRKTPKKVALRDHPKWSPENAKSELRWTRAPRCERVSRTQHMYMAMPYTVLSECAPEGSVRRNAECAVASQIECESHSATLFLTPNLLPPCSSDTPLIYISSLIFLPYSYR
jgi:hypothetical protein